VLVTSLAAASQADLQAEILLRHHLALQAGDHLVIMSDPGGVELAVAVFQLALGMGAHVSPLPTLPNQNEIELREATDETLRWVSPVARTAIETADAILVIGAPDNTRAEAGIDPERIAAFQERQGWLMGVLFQRMGRGEVRWTYTQYPTPALAQQAGMGVLEYRDFANRAMRLDQEDPVESWRKMCEVQTAAIETLFGVSELRLKGSNIDLSLSIEGRTVLTDCMGENLPAGEIYTSPVEDSVTGWVRFSYPLIYRGQEIENLQLWLEDGRVTRFEAESGEAFLETIFAIDDGARIFGELGIGLNPGVDRFTKNMLFDEKMGGTIHLALGAGFPEAGGKNRSKIHIDMLVDMSDAVIEADGTRIYENGRFVVFHEGAR
jgi:aminopeptidase